MDSTTPHKSAKPIIPLARPMLPQLEEYARKLGRLWQTGQITNAGYVREFEEKATDFLQSEDCVAMASCTVGLALTLKALGLTGKVIIPSFTFFATAHALQWSGLEPVFADIDPGSWNLDVAAVETLLRQDEGITGIMGVHVFGNPCDVNALEELAGKYAKALLFDAAHAFGSEVNGRRIGSFGEVEVFSLSPTKPVVAGEGGLASVRDERLSRLLRCARDYGNEGDYDPTFIGLNGRMSELHAALALGSLGMLEENVRDRNRIASRYRANLSGLAGLAFQTIASDATSTFKDLTVFVHKTDYGMDRDALAWFLQENGIETRKYYFPPVHRIKAYWDRFGAQYDEMLPATNRVSRGVLSLPIWSRMGFAEVDRVCEVIAEAHERAEEIEAAFMGDQRLGK